MTVSVSVYLLRKRTPPLKLYFVEVAISGGQINPRTYKSKDAILRSARYICPSSTIGRLQRHFVGYVVEYFFLYVLR